jgi:hypothetical protein
VDEDLDSRPASRFTFDRKAHVFARPRDVVERLERERTSVQLAPDQLYHPNHELDGIVRRGNLRVSEFLSDGREVARAVLQAGATFRTRSQPPDRDGERLDERSYELGRVVLMALGETELWILPAGRLAETG